MSDDYTSTSTDPKPWERLPEETSRAWHGFQSWLSLPPHRRSLVRAYQVYQGNNSNKAKPPSASFAGWARTHRWDERSAAYDEAQRAEQKEKTANHRIDAINSAWCGIIEAVIAQNEKLPTMSTGERTKYLVALRQMVESIEEKKGPREATTEVVYTDQWMPPDA